MTKKSSKNQWNRKSTKGLDKEHQPTLQTKKSSTCEDDGGWNDEHPPIQPFTDQYFEYEDGYTTDNECRKCTTIKNKIKL